MSTRKENIKLKSQAARSARKRKEKKSKLLFQLGLIGIVLAAFTVVTFVIVSSNAITGGYTPANMAGGGVRFENSLIPVSSPSSDSFDSDIVPLSKDKVDVRIYLDYICPFCGEFEKNYGDELTNLVESGDIVLEYHPVATLDRLSAGSKYSTRSAAASSCVASITPNQWLPYNTELFNNQPSENSAGLTDQELLNLAKKIGVEDSKVDSCILGKDNIAWAKKTTIAAKTNLPFVDKPLKSTPTVIVNGKLFDGSSDFIEYLNKQISNQD